ncbi:MAG: heparinase II/III family protein [Pseudomonadota bacterium]
MSAPEEQNAEPSAASADAALWRRFAGVAGDDVKASPSYRLRLSGGGADGFGLHLGSVVPGDTLRGEALMADVWRIGAERLALEPGAAPWSVAAPSRHFADRIHRFGWLPDLFTQGAAGADRAVSLVDDWIEEFGKFHGFAWRAGPTADRVWHWMSCGAPLFEVGEETARRSRIDALSRQARHLAFTFDDMVAPAARWRAACALVAVEIALNAGRKLPDAVERLDHECSAQILADGGHVSRSPQRLLHALTDLLALKALFERAGRETPDFFDKWPPRMGAMLSFFRSGDGALTPFNDGGEDRAEVVQAALDALDAPPRGFSFAMKSGFQKLEKNGLRLLLDAGAAPEEPFAMNAHCGALAFDLSDGEQRLVTSCGFSPEINLDWQAAVRRTGAHSTLAIAGRDAAPFVSHDQTRLLRPAGPDGISAKRLEETDQIWLDAQHGGWKEKFSLLHRRRLFMAGDGSRVTGEDALVRPVSQGAADDAKFVSFEIRFHLHPTATAMTAGDVIKITGPDGRAWRFKTSHEGARLESSIYVGRGRLERTEQIVLSGKADPNGDGSAPPNCVRWAILREERS